MTCYHPNKGFVVGVKDNGKSNLKFTSKEVEFISSVFSDFSSYHKSYVPIEDLNLHALEVYNDWLLVDRSCRSIPVYYCVNAMHLPCGQCIGCRIDRSKEWANRMCMEASYYEQNCFLTLTYDDMHIPKSSYTLDGDEFFESYTLRKRDLQLFMKRLRRAFPGVVIRFYACGEYGSQTMRPHYHLIIFNWFPPDAKYHHHDMRGYNYYVSEILSRLWDKGIHLVTNVSWETCAYTARYVTKKIGRDRDYYEIFNIEREFSLMSRKPGIARRFYDEHKQDFYQLVTPYIIENFGGDKPKKIRAPRYFDGLFDVENPSLLKEIKENQSRIVQNLIDLKLSKTDLNYYELLEVEEANFKQRISKLSRK